MGDVRISAAALADVGSGDFSVFEDRLLDHLLDLGVGAAGPGERRSWRGSLPVLARDLVEAGLGDVEIIVEHRLPLSSKRVDAIIAGRHPETGQPRVTLSSS